MTIIPLPLSFLFSYLAPPLNISVVIKLSLSLSYHDARMTCIIQLIDALGFQFELDIFHSQAPNPNGFEESLNLYE